MFAVFCVDGAVGKGEHNEHKDYNGDEKDDECTFKKISFNAVF